MTEAYRVLPIGASLLNHVPASQRLTGHVSLHRPDGVVVFADGTIVAIEAERSAKKAYELEETLLELLRGEGHLHTRRAYGWQVARLMSRWERSPCDEIWYFASPAIRQHLRRA